MIGEEIISAKFVDGVEVGAMSGDGQARQLRRASLGHYEFVAMKTSRQVDQSRFAYCQLWWFVIAILLKKKG